MDAARRSRLYAAIAILVLAPLAAAILIALLLLFGVEPHLVFLPGHKMIAALQSLGIPAPRAVGVLTTEAFWWTILLLAWLVVRRLRRSVAV